MKLVKKKLDENHAETNLINNNSDQVNIQRKINNYFSLVKVVDDLLYYNGIEFHKIK